VDLQWLIGLFDSELDRRKERSFQRRISDAKFPSLSTLEDFDWDFNEDIPRAEIEELDEPPFIEEKRIGLLLGETGTGKTHIAHALALNGIRRGKRIFCSSLKSLEVDVAKAKANSSLETLKQRILKSDLWVLDDWGVVSLKRDVAEEVFDLLDRRKGRTALLLTSNRKVEEWPELFPDQVLASAAIDRMFERAHVLSFQGPSYRLQGWKKPERGVDRGKKGGQKVNCVD
jgi:DNA replication protein DnaC